MIESPCINVCVIDQKTGLCEGCHRSLQEIACWGTLSEEERSSIMRDLKARSTHAQAQ